MRNSFGPWTTAIHTGAYPQLSTFWKRRMTMLPMLAGSRPLSWRDLLGLAVPGVLLLMLPLIRLQPGAVADEQTAKPKEERILYWSKLGRLAIIRPAGKERQWVSEPDPTRKYLLSPHFPSLSPDGRRVAYGMNDVNAAHVPGVDWTANVFVKDLDEKGFGIDLGIDAHMWAWSPDGTKLAITKWDVEGQKEKKMKADHWLVDVKTKERTELKIPADHVITDWSRDEKWFLTTAFTMPEKENAPPLLQLRLVKQDGTEVRRLGKPELSAAMGRLSPDGKKVLFMKMSREKRGEAQLFVMNLADGKITQVSQELNAELMGHCWSPDSKRIAYVWRQTNPAPGAQTESFLMIVDADGKNPVTLVTEKEDNQGTITLASPDWR
jgi:Tol biopolymer transport system component